jgi:hypothetical protein
MNCRLLKEQALSNSEWHSMQNLLLLLHLRLNHRERRDGRNRKEKFAAIHGMF